jgi:predicted HTH transcriptional regulator
MRINRTVWGLHLETIDEILESLRDLIATSRYAPLETDTLEIKPVPATGGDCAERYKSINAFLNTRGGILLLGIKEEQIERKRPEKRYVFTGWRESEEEKLEPKRLAKLFTDRSGAVLDLRESFAPLQIRPFRDGHIAFLNVAELAADQKFVFLEGNAYRRSGTGDHKLDSIDIAHQERYRENAARAAELRPFPGTTPESLDLNKLNIYISQLNKRDQIETLKPTLALALPLLRKKHFVHGDQATLLGMLVCGRDVGDELGFRCHLHGYVELRDRTILDTQDFIDTVPRLMEAGYAYVTRNIHVGISPKRSGTAVPEYPDTLIRETVNNALTHRDYTIDRPVVVTIHPGKEIAIQNPGRFFEHLIVEQRDDPTPFRRIIPEPEPRNPKLADVLRVERKWEGRGIGMSTLVNLCLDNQTDIPCYRFRIQDVELLIRPGRLVGERMEHLFASYDRYIEEKLQGNPLNESQKSILAYLIKSEWENLRERYTILLTPDNNHSQALVSLERAGLIALHQASKKEYPVYVADRIFFAESDLTPLREFFGSFFDAIDPFDKDVLRIVHRFNQYSKIQHPSAKQVAFVLWNESAEHEGSEIRAFDRFYRRIRNIFNRLEGKGGFVVKLGRGYQLNAEFRQSHLSF